MKGQIAVVLIVVALFAGAAIGYFGGTSFQTTVTKTYTLTQGLGEACTVTQYAVWSIESVHNGTSIGGGTSTESNVVTTFQTTGLPSSTTNTYTGTLTGAISSWTVTDCNADIQATTSFGKSVASGSTDVIVESAINSSTACSSREFWENSSAMDTLRSNVMSQPEFTELAQNRSYFDAGYSCGFVNGTQFTVDFEYSDMAHPFRVCGNSTAYPTYYIDAKIYLLPTGYDLSKTAYTMRYYDSQNLTVSCTTTTT